MVSPIWIWWVRLPRLVAANYQVLVTVVVAVLSLLFYRFHRRRSSSGIEQTQSSREATTARNTQLSWLSLLRNDANAICCITSGVLDKKEQKWILELAKSCRLIIIARGMDGKQSRAVVNEFGLDDLVPEHRIILCQTISGIYSIGRQIEPQLFIAGEDDLEALRRLEPFLRGTVLVCERDLSNNWGGTIRRSLEEAITTAIQ